MNPKYSLMNNLDIPPMPINSAKYSPQVLQSKMPNEAIILQIEELVGVYGNPQDGNYDFSKLLICAPCRQALLTPV